MGIIIISIGAYFIEIDLLTWFISAILGLIIASVNFKLNIIGGADGKAIITIAILVPLGLSPPIQIYSLNVPIILETYFYFLISIALLLISVLIYNLISKSYFELNNEPLSKKIKILLLCFKCKPNNFSKNYRLIEEVNDNEVRINLKTDNISFEESKRKIKKIIEIKKSKNQKNNFWVYPNWPLIPLILISSILALF